MKEINRYEKKELDRQTVENENNFQENTQKKYQINKKNLFLIF